MSTPFVIEERELRVPFQADSSEALLQVLSGVDIAVPPRTAGRVTAHTERWSICRLLASLAETELLRYPLALMKRERPDFELRMPGITVGIEVTESVMQDQARLDAIREQEADATAILQPRFRVTDAARSRHELEQLARGELRDSSGWAGNSVERDWAEAVSHCWSGKRASRDRAGFTRFAEVWLVIYDNLRGPALDEEEAVALLLHGQSLEARARDFHRVFIECDEDFWQIGLVEVSRTPIRWPPEPTESTLPQRRGGGM